MKKVLSLLLALLLTYGCAAAETLSLSLIGDCTIGDQYKYRGYKSGFTYKISQAGLDYPFSLAADLFAQDDLTIANCEGCFTNRASTGKFMSLGAAPEFAEVFKLGFVDVVNTANNHMRDFGSAGREDTLFLHLGLPKFEAEWKGDLKDILAVLGLEDAFLPGEADFSRLGDNQEGYYLSQVIHAAKLAVNEKGTEAAAATVAAASGSGAPPEEGITLIFDRPFLYGIADLETGIPLFLGIFE